MYNYNIESFDITRHVEDYKGRKLEDIFQNHRIITNEMGTFMEFYWTLEEISSDINLLVAKKKVLRNLKMVYYIGETIERRLIGRGINTLYDLRPHRRYRSSVLHLLKLIAEKDYNFLYQNKNVNDLDVIFCFNLEDLLFIDIETLGLYDSPIIIIGVGFFKDNKYEVKSLFARELEEEIAICEHMRKKILPNFKCLITYNGKSFDIPYLANRFLYFFDGNPMISEDDVPYEKNNTKFHHIDLYHNCRRKFKGMFEGYTLVEMEEKLLRWNRHNELPSNLVGLCYKKYKRDPERYVGLMKEVVDHNYYDLYSMPLILQKLLVD